MAVPRLGVTDGLLDPLGCAPLVVLGSFQEGGSISCSNRQLHGGRHVLAVPLFAVLFHGHLSESLLIIEDQLVILKPIGYAKKISNVVGYQFDIPIYRRVEGVVFMVWCFVRALRTNLRADRATLNFWPLSVGVKYHYALIGQLTNLPTADLLAEKVNS